MKSKSRPKYISNYIKYESTKRHKILMKKKITLVLTKHTCKIGQYKIKSRNYRRDIKTN